jgi:hypothetical protein
MLMKRALSILPFILAAWCSMMFATTNVRAQSADTLLQITVRDPQVFSDTLEFTLGLTRLSDKWERWANGSFELQVGPVPSQGILQIQFLAGTTQLPAGYLITSRVVTPLVLPGSRVTQQRLSITILGPEPFAQTVPVGTDTANPLILGRFRVLRTDGQPFQEPVDITWLGDNTYYQATAYKIDRDSTPWHITDDNIDFSTLTKFIPGRTIFLPPILFDCNSFNINYLGSRAVRLNWRTESERSLKGFIVVRGLLPFGETDTNKVEYTDTIATYRTDTAVQSKGQRGKGANYSIVDTAKLRGEFYFYKVLAYDSTDTQTLQCIKGVNVPFAVISAAVPKPNPFSEKTTIDYTLDDDVYLTCKVYNAVGQLMETLIDNQFMKLGQHSVDFAASPFALQGMYDIIFIAYPVSDPTVEISRAVVKVQLIRNKQ